ncbi:MAG: hypothetical protein R3F13_22110 [Prosthecobacter sp.]
MKWIIRIILFLVLLIAVLLWLGFSQIDRLVKAGIEQVTPPVVLTDVTVGAVKLSPFSGTGVIENFVIGNPKGYAGPYALRIGKADVAIDTSATGDGKIVLKHIHITDPEIHLEAGLNGTNLKQITKNAEAFAAGMKPSAVAAAGETPAESKTATEKDVKLQINELLIRGARVSASTTLVQGAKAETTLPEIRLTNIGDGPEGITPAALTAKVLGILSTEAAKNGAGGSLKNLLKEGAPGGGAGALKDGMKKLFGK